MIERSRAIKCPTAALQLANTKRVQQTLYETRDSELPNAPVTSASPGAPSILVRPDDLLAPIRATFMPQVTPDPVRLGFILDQNYQRLSLISFRFGRSLMVSTKYSYNPLVECFEFSTVIQ